MSKNDDKGGLGGLWKKATDRKAESNVIPLERPPADRHYVAFATRDRVERLDICRATQPSRFPAYSYLLDMSYDRVHDAAISLVYTFMVVHIEGRNLEPILHAIQSGTCERIVEFSAKEHDKPAPGEPFIERIELVTADEQMTKASR